MTTTMMIGAQPSSFKYEGKSSLEFFLKQCCNGRQTHCHNGHLVDYHKWILTRQAVVDTYQTS